MQEQLNKLIATAKGEYLITFDDKTKVLMRFDSMHFEKHPEPGFVRVLITGEALYDKDGLLCMDDS